MKNPVSQPQAILSGRCGAIEPMGTLPCLDMLRTVCCDGFVNM